MGESACVLHLGQCVAPRGRLFPTPNKPDPMPEETLSLCCEVGAPSAFERCSEPAGTVLLYGLPCPAAGAALFAVVVVRAWGAAFDVEGPRLPLQPHNVSALAAMAALENALFCSYRRQPL